MTSPDAATHFLQFGIQYYVSARSAALAQLSPVCGNLYHHAIEMLLKAQLSKKRGLTELRQFSFGHNLCSLWNAFKEDFPTISLNQFDTTIITLNCFETIRYPDSIIEKGAQLIVTWGPGPTSNTWPPERKPPPTYQIIVQEIDRLVARIVEVSSWNLAFFTASLNEYAREAITRGNPACGNWFRHR